MGSSHSTHTGAQGDLGHRVGQWAANANQGALQVAAGLHSAADTATALHQGASHLAQAAGPAVDTLRLAMANLQRAKQGGGAHYGGARRGYFGGDDAADPAKDLREYASSLSAQAKEDVIRRLARALKRAGVGVDPEGDLDEIVRQLVAQLPNPRTNQKSFAGEAQTQEHICRTVAGVLNDEFSPGETAPAAMFIDTSLSAAEVCRAVGEWAHNFAAGVNTEFLAVHASVRNALRNVEVLAEVMRETYGKIREKAEQHADAEFGREFGPLNEIYSRAQAERQRQEELLKNLLHVHLAPAAKELELAMQDESEQNALIKRLGLKPGTSEFADSLAMAISGLGTSASIATRVHRALKKVGLSVRQYLESPGYTEFERLLDAKIESGAVRAEDLAAFITAMGTLRLNFDSRQEPRFREALEGADKTGGADDEDHKSVVAKRAERRETEKNIIVRDFAGRLARHYDELLAAVKSLGPKLGKEIPLSDRTDALRDALERLRDLRAERVEFALVGLYMDAEARARKEQFMSAMRTVSASCVAVMELEMYRAVSPYFARLKAAIDAIEKSIDYFSDAVARKYGGEDGADADMTGGAPDLSVLPEVARSALSLNEAVSEFAYFYYVAKVRANLAQTASELKEYGKGYPEMLGEAVAARLYTLEQYRSQILAFMNSPGYAAAQGVSSEDAENAKKWINEEYDTKARFYRVVQAVDLYLQAFTAGIVGDPDAVRDIKRILDGTQVIARWFSEQTGDDIWKAFESMPATNFAGGSRAAAVGAAAVASSASGHYYEKLSSAVPAGTSIPGDGLGFPYLGASTKYANQAKKFVSDGMDHFQALKNLVNAFARIGDKFGGKELHTQVFMSPTQIFKGLTDYLKRSALTMYPGALGSSAPVPLQYMGPPSEGVPPVQQAVLPCQAYFSRGPRGDYAVENVYFAITIKAMAAKILTTLGVYDMFERAAPIYDLTPTRMIVGGGPGAPPEVIEGAAELYFRLPRLAEFYRLFRWDGETPGDAYRIAMLPELEGVFSGLIRIIFQNMASPESGDYSESEMQAVISEVNAIYGYFLSKGGETACQAALTAFIVEVNRRYGVIKAEDMKTYWKMVRMARTGQYSETNDTSYAILPGEGEAEVERAAPGGRFRPSPYSGYDPTTGRALDPATGLPVEPFARLERRLDVDWKKSGPRQMLRGFRESIEKEFERVDRDQFRKTSFALLIKQAQSEIRRAGAAEDKLAVAYKLIQGAGIISVDADKAYMFHETVVVGLNALCAIETLLRRFSDMVDAMDPVTIENAVMDHIYEAMKAGEPHPTFGRAAVLSVLNKGYSAAGDGRPELKNENGRFDRYIVDNAAAVGFGRAGLPQNFALASLSAFMAAEYSAAMVVGGIGSLPRHPSSYNDSESVESIAPPLGAQQVQFLRALRVFARFSVNYDRIMRDFVENVFDLGDLAQGAVAVRFAAGGLQLSFSKLRGLAETLLADVKHYLDALRPFVPKATVDRFENLSHPGSVFWIEKNLVDRFFRGSFSGEVSDLRAGESRTLDGVTRRAAAVLRNLTRQTNVETGGFRAIAAAGGAAGSLENYIRGIGGPWLVAGDFTRFEDFGAAFSRLAFYAQPPVPYAGADLSTDPYDLRLLISTRRATPQVAQSPPTPVGAGRLRRFGLYTSQGVFTEYRSLLFSFNQLVARYLSTFVDTPGGGKIYMGLINAFANGAMSRAVGTPAGNTFPDLVVGQVPFSLRGDPKPTAILLQSLAYVFQRLVQDVNPTNQIPDHLVATLSDVPLYMKESYRANLPSFVKLFSALAHKCDFIKQIIQKSGAHMARASQLDLAAFLTGGAAPPAGTKIASAGVGAQAANAAGYEAGSLNGLEDLAPGLNGDDMKMRLAAIIDAVSDGARIFAGAATEVLKELADSPIYFQTHEGSIEAYKAQNGKLPLMPLSLSLWFLDDLAMSGVYANDPRLYPNHTLGTPEFKVMYGNRQLLAQPSAVGFEQLPSVKASLDAYNASSSQRDQFDTGRYLTFVQSVVGVLRFVVDCRNYRALLSSVPGLFSSASLIGGAEDGLRRTAGSPPVGSAVYSLSGSSAQPRSAQSILSVVENSNQDEEAGNITAIVGGDAGASPGGRSRSLERILNLIDMNVIPVNFHAMMQDIPGANLYNYEYTFEQMAASLYGEQASRYSRDPPMPENEVRSTRQMLLRLLVNPYLDVSANFYGSITRPTSAGANFVYKIFRGDNDLGMGRPKFLSDQLFNKALLGSVYQTGAGEAGPAASAVLQPATPVLAYLRAEPDAAGNLVQFFPLSTAEAARVNAVAKARFDTDFARNLFFVVNVLRLVRLKLNRELTQNRGVIISTHDAVRPGLTEFGSDPFGANEVLGSVQVTGTPRFSDRDHYGI